jgi:PAS domain S-box-containing protein
MKPATRKSENKQIFDELQQSEARFRAIFENTAVGIGIMGLDRRVIDANPALCRMYGRSREELIGQTPAIVTHPDDYGQSTLDFQEWTSGKTDFYQSERRYMRKNGEAFWAHVTMSFICNSENKPLYIIGMVLDIDDKKRAQLELRKSEERFRATFESSAIGMGLLSTDGKILKVNEAVCKISGYTAEELQQRYDRQNVYPEDVDVDRDLFDELAAGKRDSYEIEKRYVRKNGDVFWARLTISAVRNPDNTVPYLVGMIEDIDTQKRVLIELEESEARFRAMFDNAMVGMTLSTLDRRILKMNEALSRITGYSLEDLKLIHPTDLAHIEDRHLGKDEFAELLAGKRNEFTLERRYIHKSGRIFWGRVSYSLVRDSKGEPCNLVGLFEDITEQKLANEKIAMQEAEYRQTLELKVKARTQELTKINQRLKDEIAQRQKAEKALSEKAAQDAITSERTRLARDLHDAVTQTLFSASLIAEVLPDLWETNPAEGEKRLGELRQLTRGALAEMRTLLVELRPNTLVQIPLSDLLRQLCESLIGRARLPIDFLVEGQAKIPPDVQIALYRITQEALNNIVKHAKATKVVVTLSLGDSVRLMIIDDGSGFEQSNVSADHLGLRIMCERAEAIGANCSIYSQPGEGTQITVIWHGVPEQSKG